MYLLDPPASAESHSPVPMLYHMDGRCYKTVSERLGLGWKVASWEVERAEAACRLLSKEGGGHRADSGLLVAACVVNQTAAGE